MSDASTADTQVCIERADESQQSFATSAPDNTLQTCPLVKQIVAIPRKRANIFDSDKALRPLLPDRYPPAQAPLKTIEHNFYPDLNRTRTITAVVTDVSWNPAAGARPEPAAGIPVTFSKGGRTTANITLSAMSATSDAEGCASIDITVGELLVAKGDIEAAATIEIIATLPQGNGGATASVVLTIHRNEDVDGALAPSESPDAFAATLSPVLNLETWIVEQATKHVTSNGAKAVQQLLNQVACRRHGGGHEFLKPDGQFGSAGGREARRFVADFGTEAAAGAAPLEVFTGRQFGVSVEEVPISPPQGVKTYVKLEYGNGTEGSVIDAHLLVGPERWVRGVGARVAKADGLLDLYAAVVWEFIETTAQRGTEYANVVTSWYRHPNDNGPAQNPWPDLVQQGVAYWYGGARKLEDFVADLTTNSATPANGTWFQYLRQNNGRIGLHQGQADNDVVVPTPAYNQYPHLNTDPDITNTTPANAPPNVPPHYVLHHVHGLVMNQYTGIDCSGFCQHVAIEALFRAEHCGDLAGQRICQRVPLITHNNGIAVGKLSTGLWQSHYAEMPSTAWRREVAFRGDLLNVSGSHIVVLETADRAALVGSAAGDVWILQASGDTRVTATAAPHWAQTECIRRVVHSPLAQWSSGWNSWGHATANVEYGRIYLWN
jgi:hypothetical protein